MGYPGVIDTRRALTNGPAGELIVAEHPNGLGAAVLAIENELGTDPAGSLVDVKTRLAVALNNDGTVKTSVIQGASAGIVDYTAGVFTIRAGIENIGSSNCGLLVSQSSNTMTFFLMTAALATPSSTAPVVVSFPNTPITSGGASSIILTSAISTIISSGARAGMIANQTGRLYVGVLNNAGTPELCWWNPLETHISTPTYTLFGFSESELQSTTAEGAIGGADTAGILFSTTARSNLPFKALGYVDVQMGASVGQWSNTPTAVRVLGAGMKRTGDVIQRISTITGTLVTGTTVIPADTTLPQQGEGNRWLSATITSSNPANLWHIQSRAIMASSALSRLSMGVFRFGVADAMGVSNSGVSVSDDATPLDLEFYSTITSASAVGFQMRGGDSAAATVTLNGTGGAAAYIGGLKSYLVIEEVCI